MDKDLVKGHIVALITIMLWGTTFISTKILLEDFTPLAILLLRFVLGLAVLIAAYPKPLKLDDRKQELTFAAAGLCGICLYYLMENIALTYSMASNVGVVVSVAPFFTGIVSRLFTKDEEKLTPGFFIGFIVAMAGICLISFNGIKLQINPIGDILAVSAAAVWAFYSIFVRKATSYGYNIIQTTRRTFIYGLAFMIPVMPFMNFSIDAGNLMKVDNLINLIYLGAGASALCFVTWNMALKILGTVKTSVYIYMIPVITVIASAVILKEKITVMSAVGTLLVMAGLLLSEGKTGIRSRKTCERCFEMKWEIKEFSQLTLDELYEISRLRSEVFFIEQGCMCEDLDMKDQDAYHMIGTENGRMAAYLRILKKGAVYQQPSIGRVLVEKSCRRRGIAGEMMKKAMDFVTEELKENSIRISAQLYLKDFYTELGFEQISDIYQEGGIDHISMIYEKR